MAKPSIFFSIAIQNDREVFDIQSSENPLVVFELQRNDN